MPVIPYKKIAYPIKEITKHLLLDPFLKVEALLRDSIVPKRFRTYSF